MSKQEKEEKVKEFWEYYEATQGTITITDPVVLDWCAYYSTPISMYICLAALQINEAQEHKDPFDHIIIAQAISHKMMLVSSDTKFPFYRKQGLRLIENL